MAMRCVGVAVVVAALTGGPVAGLTATAARAEVVITISKAQQRVAIAVNGAEQFRWPVSTGRRGFDTPIGKFRPVRLERDWYSRKYQMAPMPHSIFFYKGYAMHGTLEEKNLGRRASHGCVRLSRENAATLFAMVRANGARNARIVVVNGPLPDQQDRVPLPMARVAKMTDVAEALAHATDEDTIQVTVTPDVLPPARPAVLEVAAMADIVPQPVAAVAAPVAIPPVRPAPVVRAEALRTVRPAAVQKFTSVGSEAEVLRGREAWLRSLDRKYGIVR